MKNLKTTIITALLLLATVGGAVAQEKYEFAIVENYGNTALTVVKHSTENIQLPKGSDALGELIKKVEEMNKVGWEVYSNTTLDGNGISHVYYLRRKLKE